MGIFIINVDDMHLDAAINYLRERNINFKELDATEGLKLDKCKEVEQ